MKAILAVLTLGSLGLATVGRRSPVPTCPKGMQWSTQKRDCIVIPAGQPGTTIYAHLLA
ncbi:hypothetical protein UVI_02044730 [Ustilaginoidea virens]|uniref:Uncharacterized protein n=1 Tax=Ustilaginoidea virens TaxID=1159556 RepID=A0A1B5L468_USTVR|nr:hypothetical protein UVI_02044730 [Ustilaginoidea virens]